MISNLNGSGSVSLKKRFLPVRGSGSGSVRLPDQKSLASISHLTPLVMFFFTTKQSQKGGSWHNAPLITLLPRSLRLGACEQIKVYSKEVNTFTSVDLATVCYAS